MDAVTLVSLACFIATICWVVFGLLYSLNKKISAPPRQCSLDPFEELDRAADETIRKMYRAAGLRYQPNRFGRNTGRRL